MKGCHDELNGEAGEAIDNAVAEKKIHHFVSVLI